MLKKSISIFLFAALVATSNAQSVGELDPTFAEAGKYTEDFGFHDNLTDIKVQSDGKIITVGTAINSAFSGQLLIKRLNADGTSDNTFSTDGTVIINDYTESYAYECIVLPDGKILVAGSIANEMYQFSLAVFKLNSDGSFDTSFGVDGHAIHSLVAGDSQVYDMVVDANGKIVVAGNMVPLGEYGMPIVCRLNADGSMDTGFGTDGVVSYTITNDDNVFRNVAIDSDGRIVAAGHWGQGITAGGQMDNDAIVVRLMPDGSIDNSFASEGKFIFPVHNLTEDLFGLDINTSNEIYVCGYSLLDDSSFDGLIVKINENGAFDNTFGGDGIVEFNAGPQDVFMDMMLYEGQIYLGGSTGGFLFENRDFMVMRYELDGTIDESFGVSGLTLTTIFASFDDANAMTIQPDDKILLAGKGNNSTNNDAAITRYLNNANVSVSELEKGSSLIFPSVLESGDMLTTLWNGGEPSLIAVYNAHGKLIHQERIPAGNNKAQLSTAGWSAGLYQVLLLQNGSPFSQGKIVVR